MTIPSTSRSGVKYKLKQERVGAAEMKKERVVLADDNLGVSSLAVFAPSFLGDSSSVRQFQKRI